MINELVDYKFYDFWMLIGYKTQEETEWTTISKNDPDFCYNLNKQSLKVWSKFDLILKIDYRLRNWKAVKSQLIEWLEGGYDWCLST